MLMVFLIKSTKAGAKKARNVHSVYMKILMNHLQLIALTASFNFNWPKIVLDYFETSRPISEAST